MISMIMINGNWEQVNDLSDIVRIVKENIGDEFVKKVEEICGEPSIELEEQIFMLQNKIKNTEDRINGVRDLFIEVLSIDTNRLSEDEEEKYIEKFDSILRGD